MSAATITGVTLPGNTRVTSLSAVSGVVSLIHASASRSASGLSRIALSRANAYGTKRAAAVMA